MLAEHRANRLALALVLAAALSFSSSTDTRTREFDILIFGATGFVGRLVTASLLGDRAQFRSLGSGVHLNSGAAGLRFALAGRNELQLRQLRDGYQSKGFDVSGVKLIVADAADPASLDKMVAQAKVVLTTVLEAPNANGRFDASTLIRKSIEHGTHLLDLDGFWLQNEALVSEMDALARSTGTVYSPACGEVSVLPDMTTYRAWTHLGRPKLRRSAVYHAYFNGIHAQGTLAASFWESYDAPHLRRTGTLLAYGDEFEFSEVSPSNDAKAAYLGNKREAVRKVAKFVTSATVEAEDGRQATATVSGGEVDYEETARILLEMAISLVQDGVPAASAGGVWTAAAGWGDALLARLATIGLGVEVSQPGQTAAVIVREVSKQYAVAEQALKGAA
jgi:short subunit dehydrogenase-like uncharacterized protein